MYVIFRVGTYVLVNGFMSKHIQFRAIYSRRKIVNRYYKAKQHITQLVNLQICKYLCHSVYNYLLLLSVIDTHLNIFAECEGDVVDVIFILDGSGSVGQVNFDKVKDFLVDVIQRVDMDSGAVRLGLLIFDSEAQVVFYVSNVMTNFEL